MMLLWFVMVQGQVGVCRYLVSDGKICGTKLRKRFMYDYWFCPKCSPETVKENIRDLFNIRKIKDRRFRKL